jgi:DNA-binding SARP family transcriptional activator/tetratricopeptide (TPR) repeat protein
VLTAGGGLTVGVLGPLEVALGGRPVRLTSSRLRTLLVVLAMAAGTPLPAERLAAALWDDELPEHARRVVQTYLGRLRDALGEGMIVTEPAGYRLRIGPEHVDALRFTRLLDAATRAPDPAGERTRLDEALALWRGEPFDDVPSHWLARSERPRLVERYLAATERRIDLGGGNCRAGDAVAQLHELTARYPLRESLWVRLLVALDRSGRQAEALAAYEQIRRRLAEHLGTGPGPELRRIHADLLAGRRSGPEPAAAAGPVIPRQLPADIDGFTGRTGALEALDMLAGHREQPGPGAVVIVAIAGTAGVGKTSLAVHWAHRIADRYPDGQLYVNLRGFAPAGAATTSAEAIRGFLAALDVPPHQIPSDLDAQIGLYRSLLAGKRMLLVLDNARDSDQVRPLLPGSPSCLVLVTSRNQLTSLVAAEAAKPLVLNLLPVDEARQLLIRRLGPDRVAAEPAAVEDIITRCVRLPLALAIAAAHAATRPQFPLSTIAAQLRDRSTRLDTLGSDDPAADVRAVFSWSHQALSPPAARLFRLLGLHPGPDVSVPAAASLAALPAGVTRTLLTELHRGHLLSEHRPGRYAFHDLLRTYATELAGHHEDHAGRHAALHRLLDHYLHTALNAGSLTSRGASRPPITVGAPAEGVSPEQVAGPGQALAWFTTERDVLLAAIQLAAAHGFDTHTWQLAWAIGDFLYMRSRWHDEAASQRAAVDALHRLGNRVEEGNARRYLARAYVHLGRTEDAEAELAQALAVHREAGDAGCEARTLRLLGWLLSRQARHTETLEHSLRALELFRQLGDRIGEADARESVGSTLAELGEYEPALDHCLQSLHLNQEFGNRLGQASALDSLGAIHLKLGQYEQAAARYRQALDLVRGLDDRYDVTHVLTHLGQTQLAAGDQQAAQATWLEALSILDELGHPDAAEVRAMLDAVPG